MKSILSSRYVGATLCLFFAAAGMGHAPEVDAQIVTTIAGGNLGDGGPGTNAVLNFPISVAVDGSGNVYFSDTNAHRVRKVTPAGVISTVAGTGHSDFGGDGGPATQAHLTSPNALAVDAAGNVYISEQGNYRIRKVTVGGIITTVAGNGFPGTRGDGGQATAANLQSINGMAIDGLGNLYVSDSLRVRRVGLNGVITTVAGTGTQGFSGDGQAAVSALLAFPYGLAFDAVGSLYIADAGNNRIRKVDANGIIQTVAGAGAVNAPGAYGGDDGLATNALFNSPRAVTFDAAGNMWIADTNNLRLRRVDTSGIVRTLVGSGTFGVSSPDGTGVSVATISSPSSVAVDAAGTVYFPDGARVRSAIVNGTLGTKAGGPQVVNGDGGPAVQALVRFPEDVVVDGAGNVFFSEPGNHRVRKVDANGIVSTVAGTGTSGYSGDGSAATGAAVNSPSSLALDAAGNLYFADRGNHRVRKIDSSGTITTVAGNGSGGFGGDNGSAINAMLFGPAGLTFDSAGNLYIVDRSNHRVRKIDVGGTIRTVAGNGTGEFLGDGGLAVNASLNFPSAVAVDTQGNVFIADLANNRIRKVNTVGQISTVMGGDQGSSGGPNGVPAEGQYLNFPRDLAISPAGELYIGQSGSIRKITTAGLVYTVAGLSTLFSFNGDGHAAANTGLSVAYGMGLDSAGNLYFADRENHRIRKISPLSSGSPARATDMNGDGRSDILWHNSATGMLYELPMNGPNPFGGAVIDQKTDLNWKVVAVADLNADGRADVVWQHDTTGQVYGLLMNGTTVLGQGTIYTEPNTNWKVVGAGDFNGDGNADLLWKNNATGDVFLLLLNGLSVVSGGVIYSEPNTNWQIQKVADLNGDGRADVLWRNVATGDVFVLLMNGTTVTGGGVIYSEPNTAWQIQAAADFNGDGRADVLWRNTTTGDVFMMLMNGTTITGGSVFYGEPNAAWKIVATGDYNGDGRADILWRNTATGQVFMMFMDGFTLTASTFVYTEPDQNWKILGP